MNSVALNNEISLHAKRKNLKESIAAFEKSVENHWANSHTYAAILNAHVRCGDIVGARNVFDQLKNSRIPLDVISCTTMMKGYCGCGDIDNAFELFSYMEAVKPPVIPNVRTINTFLRGCLLAGGIHESESIYQKMLKQYKVTPDISTYEYLITLYCHCMKLHKALPIIGRLKDDSNNIEAVATMYVHVARTYILLCDWKGCRRAIKSAKDLLAASKTTNIMKIEREQDSIDQIVNNHSDDELTGEGQTMSKKEASGGKRAWKGNESEDTREASNQIYRQHRLAELQTELNLIEEYCLSKYTKKNTSKLSAQISFSYFTKIIPFSVSSVQQEHRDIMINNLLQSLTIRFGIDSLITALNSSKKLNNIETLEVPNESSIPVSVAMQETIISSSTLQTAVGNRFNINGKFDFTQDIRQLSDTSSTSTTNSSDNNMVKVKLEICSGVGEWVVEQASNDPTSLWLALELRHDRLYQTLIRAVLKKASNLLFIGGDARDVLSHRFDTDSVSSIFINHPEPPQQTAADNLIASQASHLLDNAFIKDCVRILSDQGQLTIVTDNLWYGRLLLKQIYEDPPESLYNINTSKRSNWLVTERIGLWSLYEGVPGSAAGHVVEASSYFDRLWKRGQLTKRYFLVLQKRVNSSAVVANGHNTSVGCTNASKRTMKFSPKVRGNNSTPLETNTKRSAGTKLGGVMKPQQQRHLQQLGKKRKSVSGNKENSNKKSRT